MAKDLSDITSDDITKYRALNSNAAEILPGMQPNARRPFQGGEVLKDIGKHLWKGTEILPNLLNGIKHIDQDVANTYNLVKNEPGRAGKAFGSEFAQTYGRMLNAPSAATQYGEQRGALPDYAALPELPDVLTGNNQEPMEDERILRFLANLSAHGAPALATGGASLPYTMTAEAVGQHEGPILPWIAGNFMKNGPKNAKSFSQTATAGEVAKVWREGQKYFTKEANAIFNAPGVPRQVQYRIPPSAERFFTKNFPTDSQNLVKYLQTRAPEDLQAALSDMKGLKRWIESKKASEVSHGVQAYEQLQNLIPDMETHIESALQQGGDKVVKRYSKFKDDYRKRMVPIDKEVKDAVRAFEQKGLNGSYGHPGAVISAAKNTPNDAFLQAYQNLIPGLKKELGPNYLGNVIKNVATDPVALLTGGAVGGFSIIPPIYRALKGEQE